MQVSMMKVRGIFQLYQKLLIRRPYLIQAVQTGTLMGAGDIISQVLIENKSLKNMDIRRTLKFSSIGFFVGVPKWYSSQKPLLIIGSSGSSMISQGPALRVWYGLLNKHVGSSGKTVAIKKVFIDQAIFAPAFLFLLLVAVGTLQGKSLDSIKRDMSENYFDVLKTNYYIWPMVQLLNFYYIPLQYQVLIVQSVALFWNTYLSWKTNRQKLAE